MSDLPPEDEPRPRRRRRLGGWGGCLLWAFAWLFVVAAGCSVGLVLRPDPHAPAQVASGNGWKVQVHNDDGDKCVELVIGNEVRAGQCGYLANGSFKETSYEVGGNQVVIFANVPDDVTHVRLRLADGSRPVVETGKKKDIPYFVYLADGPDKGPSELLDEHGQVVTP
jgi:hypothetical protein